MTDIWPVVHSTDICTVIHSNDVQKINGCSLHMCGENCECRIQSVQFDGGDSYEFSEPIWYLFRCATFCKKTFTADDPGLRRAIHFLLEELQYAYAYYVLEKFKLQWSLDLLEDIVNVIYDHSRCDPKPVSADHRDLILHCLLDYIVDYYPALMNTHPYQECYFYVPNDTTVALRFIERLSVKSHRCRFCAMNDCCLATTLDSYTYTEDRLDVLEALIDSGHRIEGSVVVNPETGDMKRASNLLLKALRRGQWDEASLCVTDEWVLPYLLKNWSIADVRLIPTVQFHRQKTEPHNEHWELCYQQFFEMRRLRFDHDLHFWYSLALAQVSSSFSVYVIVWIIEQAMPFSRLKHIKAMRLTESVHRFVNSRSLRSIDSPTKSIKLE